MQESPFLRHRDKVMGHYSTAVWLRRVVLAMWSGSTDPVGLSQLGSLDDEHYRAFADMTAHYRLRGENDPAFHALVQSIQERQREEQEAKDRDARLERWCSETKACLRERGLRSGELDDRYNWFESLFDQGKSPEDAARMAAAGTPT